MRSMIFRIVQCLTYHGDVGRGLGHQAQLSEEDNRVHEESAQKSN